MIPRQIRRESLSGTCISKQEIITEKIRGGSALLPYLFETDPHQLQFVRI